MTISKDEYDKRMQGRTRPLTDPHMNNNKASKWRAEEAASAPTNDDTIDRIVKVIEDRKRRNTAANVVSMKNFRPKKLTREDLEVVTELDAAITRMDRLAYRKNQPKPFDPKDAA